MAISGSNFEQRVGRHSVLIISDLPKAPRDVAHCRASYYRLDVLLVSPRCLTRQRLPGYSSAKAGLFFPPLKNRLPLKCRYSLMRGSGWEVMAIRASLYTCTRPEGARAGLFEWERVQSSPVSLLKPKVSSRPVADATWRKNNVTPDKVYRGPVALRRHCRALFDVTWPPVSDVSEDFRQPSADNVSGFTVEI